MGVDIQRHVLAALPPGHGSVLQEAGWAPRAGQDECRKSRSLRDSIPGCSSPQRATYKY